MDLKVKAKMFLKQKIFLTQDTKYTNVKFKSANLDFFKIKIICSSKGSLEIQVIDLDNICYVYIQ